MEFETILFAAIQSSFLLGLLHGVNPCGHSWLVLAPFVAGEKNGGRVALLTFAFVSGTALACLALGASIGAISRFVPLYLGAWVETGTSVILIILGLLLIYNPHILHNHEHDDHHKNGIGQDDNHDHHNHHKCTAHCHSHDSQGRHGLFSTLQRLTNNTNLLPFALFGIGFVNMIVPCPTAAIMYGYALNAGNAVKATLVFGTYAMSTAIAVGGVIFLIFKATNMVNSLQKGWVEPLVMRLSGLVIVIFSVYGIYQAAA
ncbi:sulfite exporter TauE/SafE family protein [Desulforhopalus sp. IMCC35007]|uniref:urease accessory protein UreH domain-containing protein n=1 Tax=Desulforhopalus sp. IMCC35007 TaxID=2569543 RepID=UPI0010AE18D4|nr:sulfite exporter TauE/SafE family protein [Desulforhopalus sp. IMCC35007]TKB10874.1 sulfite exporter TauE/SafE family protein [Desulforhopalus sp. IMCC35007]